ncbi:MAG: ABC transporter permease [Spirochaetae bacterium HGW-Spirochaetae-1]|jgi:ABC-2 type transport system permease protein|nr:MAG: ABC transporter permease [Spirochaetae bacterium HGW-Spirochaetae-1]
MNFINPMNVRSMLKKEFKQLFRDPRMRAMIVGPPIIMLMLFGYAVNTDVNEVRMAVIDGDRTAMSRDFISAFTSSPTFEFYAYVDSPAKAVEMLDRGDIDFFMQIERGFSRNIRKGLTAGAQVIIDGSDSSRASVIISYINAVILARTQDFMKDRIRLAVLQQGAAGRKMPGSINLEQRIFFNQDLTSRNFFLPGVIGLLIALLTIMVTSMSIVKERESGTIEQINVSPLRPLEYILGKMIPFALVAFVDICIIVFLAITWFNVPFQGSFIFLLFSGVVFILSTLAVGLYISTISTTQQQAMLSSFLFFLPAMLLSGFVFPIYSMPESIQLVTYLNPLRYFMTIIRSVFLKGGNIMILWKDLFLLLLLGATLLFMSVKRYSKRMA